MPESPLDRALSLCLDGKREDALCVLIPLLENDPSSASVLYVMGRALPAPHADAAFELAIARATEGGNLALAVAAAQQAKKAAALDAIAAAFCKSSKRLGAPAAKPPALQDKPMLPTLSLRSTELLVRAESALEAARTAKPREASAVSPVPVFSSLDQADLAALLATLEAKDLRAEQIVVQEGAEGAEAYLVARGELEVRKSAESKDEPAITLARLNRGMMFGEMALLAEAPRAASVVCVRPSIVLVIKREALAALAQKRTEVGRELAAYCRGRMMANVLRTSPVLLAVPLEERQELVERFQMRIFEKQACIIRQGDESQGIHLIASGEVVVVRNEGAESLVLSTLGAGQVVGEVALVLRRAANADVVCVHPTITLHLPREDFLSVVRAHPGTLHGLYLLAVERDEETSMVVGNTAISLGDDVLV
jgi:CRP-like cAMP-binding protein